MKLDPVNVAAQFGHSNPNVTVGTYSHLFDKARAADSMRTALGDGFGHLLAVEGHGVGDLDSVACGWPEA